MTGEVVCHHSFGLSIRLYDRDEYGHIDIPHVSSDPVHGPDDLPPIGTVVRARVVTYSPTQVRLHLKGVQQPDGGIGEADASGS